MWQNGRRIKSLFASTTINVCMNVICIQMITKKNIEKEKKKISDRRTLRFMEEFRFFGFFIFTLMNTFFIELNFFKLFFLFPWYIKYMIENLIFP